MLKRSRRSLDNRRSGSVHRNHGPWNENGEWSESTRWVDADTRALRQKLKGWLVDLVPQWSRDTQNLVETVLQTHGPSVAARLVQWLIEVRQQPNRMLLPPDLQPLLRWSIPFEQWQYATTREAELARNDRLTRVENKAETVTFSSLPVPLQDALVRRIHRDTGHNHARLPVTLPGPLLQQLLDDVLYRAVSDARLDVPKLVRQHILYVQRLVDKARREGQEGEHERQKETLVQLIQSPQFASFWDERMWLIPNIQYVLEKIYAQEIGFGARQKRFAAIDTAFDDAMRRLHPGSITYVMYRFVARWLQPPPSASAQHAQPLSQEVYDGQREVNLQGTRSFRVLPARIVSLSPATKTLQVSLLPLSRVGLPRLDATTEFTSEPITAQPIMLFYNPTLHDYVEARHARSSASSRSPGWVWRPEEVQSKLLPTMPEWTTAWTIQGLVGLFAGPPAGHVPGNAAGTLTAATLYRSSLKPLIPRLVRLLAPPHGHQQSDLGSTVNVGAMMQDAEHITVDVRSPPK